ncbi:MAG: metallo-mystery pair system four-Cys motif protein [Chloroflexi bacterium]|nr:metallo-mystery pair system four-Cys motif protein [Chloroflexota bacterium]
MNVGDKPAVCGQSYPGVGSAGTEVSFTDLRFYVSNIRLVNAQGQEVPLELAQDGVWQYQNVALLDFEDGSAGCSEGGNTALNSVVKGSVPAGRYTAVAFDLGVPFALNHADVAVAPSPLNIQALWWNWQGGYKFMRVDMLTGAPGAAIEMSAPAPTMDMSATAPASQGEMAEGGTPAPTAWFIHLGSTGCQSNDRAAPPAAPCSNPNLVSARLDGFDPSKSVIVADLASLLQPVPLDQNTPEPPGCMSGPMDPDCPTLFSSFGLDLTTGAAVGTQQLFRLQNP